MATDDVQIQIHRAPLEDLDPRDAIAARRWVREVVSDAFALTGALPPQVRLLGDGFSETIPLHGLAPLGEEARAAAVFVGLDRPGVLRRLREGHAIVDGRHVIAVLDWGDGWWLATRRVGQGADHVGVFHGPWEERSGAGLDDLPDPFRAWADAEGAVVALHGATMTPPPPAEIEGSMMPLDSPPPPDPAQLANALGPLLDVEVAEGRVKGLIALVFTRDALWRYDLPPNLPGPLDELVRTFADRPDTIGVAVVHPCVVETPQGTVRGWAYAVEAGGKRVDRVMLLKRTDDGRILKKVVLQEREAGLWLGKKPRGDVTLSALGIKGEA